MSPEAPEAALLSKGGPGEDSSGHTDNSPCVHTASFPRILGAYKTQPHPTRFFARASTPQAVLGRR